MRTIDIQSESSNRVYRVEEREDTKFGGHYVFCPCPAWKFGGQECKHTTMAKAQWGMAIKGKAWTTPSLVMATPTNLAPDHVVMHPAQGVPGKFATGVEATARALDPHKYGDCGLAAGHTAADHDAAVALGVA